MPFELDFEDQGGTHWVQKGSKEVLKPEKAGTDSGEEAIDGGGSREGRRACLSLDTV